MVTSARDWTAIFPDPEAAIEYHARAPAGKIGLQPTKPCLTQHDLALAYTPGVAIPCLCIKDDPDRSYELTGRGNLVAVISNGTAVLGLGHIGALAGKPVMEGKAVLFKRFAGIDAIDLEIDTTDPWRVIEAVKLLEPSFGGINLEDIRAPDCFLIERELQKAMAIPVFHDDQHGTAVVVGAALRNALHLTGREPATTKVVFSGAGAAGIACARLLLSMGIRSENLVMTDVQGVVWRGRPGGLHEWLAPLAAETAARTLAEALVGADVFIGVSAPRVVTGEMIKAMAPDPIIFALANPVPEIPYNEARAARPDAIVATGRSDLPNQINNVLGFPFIFRGALDIRARAIDEGMKLAAVEALAALAREPVPDAVVQAYGGAPLAFGREYLLPRPFDPRLLERVAAAVAAAGIRSGVARLRDWDADAYSRRLRRLAAQLPHV